jgi:hypothetical protein
MCDTYIVTAVSGPGELIGVITDALTGAAVGTFATPYGGMVTIPMGTPLCYGCDEPAEDGFCLNCDVPLVAVEQLGRGRIAA